MKKILFPFLISLLLIPCQAFAIVGFSPVGLYGYLNDRAMWEDDTLDANDANAVGDVSWFYKEPISGITLPHEIYIGSQKKFNEIIFSIGNSPLNGQRNNPFARFRFSYPRTNNVGNYEFVPLEVKDLDGGLSRSNSSYRYSFTAPTDWLYMSAHVQAQNTYFVKIECVNNCASADPVNNPFQINEVNLRLEPLIQPIRGGVCTLQPVRAECFRMGI